MAVKNSAAVKPGDEPGFEATLAELEEIVSQLEAGAKPLDESLALYERGVAALRRCHLMLDKAEQRIRLLVKGANGEAQIVENHSVPVPSANSNNKEAAPRRRTRANSEAADDSAQNFGQPSVDAGGQSGDNPHPSGKPAALKREPGSEEGGSLFGHSK